MVMHFICKTTELPPVLIEVLTLCLLQRVLHFHGLTFFLSFHHMILYYPSGYVSLPITGRVIPVPCVWFVSACLVYVTLLSSLMTLIPKLSLFHWGIVGESLET